MAGIEFVGAGADDQFDDSEDLPGGPGPHRPWPRWMWALAGLLVVAVAVGVLVSSHSDGGPSASRSPTPSASPFPSIGPGPTDTSPQTQISALTSDGTSLFWVAGSRLFRAGPVGRAAASVPISPSGGDFAELQLVPDPARKVVWVVSYGSADSSGGAGNVEGYRTTDLSLVAGQSARSLISGGAVLNGALYVLASGELLRIAAGGPAFTRVASVDPHAHDLVAIGDALLFIEGGNSSAIGRWTAAGGVSRPVVLTTTDSSLAVVGSTVYVTGTRDGRDEVDTLSALGAPDQQGLETGLTKLQFVATGRRSLILLGTDDRGLELACITVQPRSGILRPVVQALAAATSANVAVLGTNVFQAVGDGVRPAAFPSGGCPG